MALVNLDCEQLFEIFSQNCPVLVLVRGNMFVTPVQLEPIIAKIERHLNH
jgi:hypothetical protein